MAREQRPPRPPGGRPGPSRAAPRRPPGGDPRRVDGRPAPRNGAPRARVGGNADGAPRRRRPTADPRRNGGPGPRPGTRPRPPGAPPRNAPRARRRDRKRDGGLLWRARRPLFVLGFLVFAGFAAALYYLAHVPLPNPHPQAQTSYIYGAGPNGSRGSLLTTYQVENRTDVPLGDVPKVVVDAVTSTEDRHFFHEGAVNPISTVRALVSDLFGSGSLQGGSTITQQYVKQAYLTPQRTLARKIKEAFIAIKLDHEESKDQILDGYLNTIYFGRGAYGIEAAAQTYFGENAGQLKLPEASLLAGLIREPDIADPAADPAVARTNQDDTLDSMVRDGQITPAQAAAVKATPFRRYVLPATDSSASGGAGTPVPGDQYFLAAVHTELVATYGANEVQSGGLRVTTTLDPTMQAEGYDEVYGSGPNALDPAKGEPSGALVSINDSGQVQALVGGQNYVTGSQVDLALGANGGGSGRLAGSTFKAFMLAELVKQGYSVSSTLPAPASIIIPHGNSNGTDWKVSNDEGESSASDLSIVDATALSINTVYAQIVEKLGAKSLDTMAESLGIAPSQLPGAYPAQVLGAADVSPLEMADAYATFADGGVYHSPVLITKVTTSSGKVLPLPGQTTRTVLTPAQVQIVDYVLQQVVIDGTGTAANGVGSEIAGKTGTTDKSEDAWFIGYTPKLTTAVWMGYARNETPMGHFRGLKSVNGGTIPAAIWHDAMTRMLASDPQDIGTFPTVESLPGTVLTAPTDVVYPTTTITEPPTTTTLAPVTTTTAVPAPTTTTATVPATTSPPTAPPTTTPPTAPPTTEPPATTPTTAATSKSGAAPG